MIDPISFGVTAGLGIFNSFLGYNAESDAVAARNKQRELASRQAFRQRLAIRNTDWNNEVKRYGLRVDSYKRGLTARANMTAKALAQDELNLNQMMKGMRFASQDAAIAQAQQVGKTQATAQSGRTAGRRMAMDVAAFGRNQAKREEKMLGEIYAKNLKAEARVATLDAQNQAAHAEVAYAPQYGAPSTRPYVQREAGPSKFSLYQGILGAGMAGFSAGQSQYNFREGLKVKNYNQAP